MRGLFRLFAAPAAIVACDAAALAAESFPSKQVHLLIPYPAGGAVDILGRTVGDDATCGIKERLLAAPVSPALPTKAARGDGEKDSPGLAMPASGEA